MVIVVVQKCVKVVEIVVCDVLLVRHEFLSFYSRGVVNHLDQNYFNYVMGSGICTPLFGDVHTPKGLRIKYFLSTQLSTQITTRIDTLD
jgi:hypothetical protein